MFSGCRSQQAHQKAPLKVGSLFYLKCKVDLDTGHDGGAL
jgi:hypothetical protein